jgi:transcriptional regulator with XRE-family HTH domain
MQEKDDLARKIGSKLKQLRKRSGLTLKNIAGTTELSSALLSRIENGLAMPSIQTLQVIANTMKVNLGYFFEKEEKERGYVISRQGTRKVSYSERGSKGKIAYEVELLGEGMENPFMEPIVATLVARNDQDLEGISHGGQELLFVLEGKMELTLGEKKFILKKGDAAYYDGDIPHKGISLGKRLARTLNVHLIPGRRVGTFEITD